MKESIQLSYYSGILKLSELFGKFNFTESSIFNTAFKKMLYLKLKKKYSSRDFNTLFETSWKAFSPHLNQDITLNKRAISTLIEIGIAMTTNTSIRSMHGIQPMGSPVSLVYYTDRVNGEFSIMSNPVQARTRKFKTQFTFEALHTNSTIISDSEFFTILSKELDGEFIREFISNVNIHSKSKPLKIKSMGISDIEKIINEINLSRLKIDTGAAGHGNVVWVNSIIGELFDKFNFLDSDSKNPELDSLNMVHMGTLNDNVDVYSSEHVSSDNIIIGYKGNNGEVNCGLIFCPYVPLACSGLTPNSETLQPELSMYTRYGIFSGDSDGNENERYNYYRVINLELPE